MEQITGLVAVVMTFLVPMAFIYCSYKLLMPVVAILVKKLDPNAGPSAIENKPELSKLNQELEDYKQRMLKLEESHKFMEDLVYKQTVKK